MPARNKCSQQNLFKTIPFYESIIPFAVDLRASCASIIGVHVVFESDNLMCELNQSLVREIKKFFAPNVSIFGINDGNQIRTHMTRNVYTNISVELDERSY